MRWKAKMVGWMGALGMMGGWNVGCVQGEYEEGAQVKVRLVGVESDGGEGVIEVLGMVFDHVELLGCESEVSSGAGLGLAWLWGKVVGTAEAAHLPEAPHRLLGARKWMVVEGGELVEGMEAGVIEPVLRDYCGVRVGIYSALPDTQAVHEGVEVGESLWLRMEGEGEERVEVKGSVGFDLRWDRVITVEELEQGPIGLEVQIKVDELEEGLLAAGDALTAHQLAQAIVEASALEIRYESFE